jgi:hypothetical protein
MSHGLPSELPALGDALSWFEASGSPEALDHAFLAAGVTSELRDAGEESWERALGERYASVRRRYAPRTKSGSRGLREAVRTDAHTREALSGRLGRWLAEGAHFTSLAAELEAAFVHSRTPGAVA